MTSNLTSRLCAAALMLGAPLAARAQVGGGELFISPCGKPYRADAGAPYPVVVWFAQADTNHDGFLDRGEFRADAAAFFAELDANHDGVIDSHEIGAYETTMVPEILHGPGPSAMGEARLILVQYGGSSSDDFSQYMRSTPGSRKRQQLSEMTGAAPYGLLAEPEPVSAADTQFNGRITPAEFQAAADRRFEALDVKGQGKIALKDLPPTAAQEAQRP